MLVWLCVVSLGLNGWMDVCVCGENQSTMRGLDANANADIAIVDVIIEMMLVDDEEESRK